jgi:BNR/Asp-box repeat
MSKQWVRLSPWRMFVAVVLAAMLPRPADANGRYPQSVSVHFQPGNAQRILVGATFGLLISDDDGATWRWTCEQNIGYGGIFDPIYEISAAGTLYATTFDGLSISRDSGCTWKYASTGGLEGLWSSDVHINASDGAVWVTTSSGGSPNNVFVSHDDGHTFAAKGLLHDQAWWKSVRSAPSDPNRVYVTGYQVTNGQTDDGGQEQPTPLFYRSDNGGTSWTDMHFSFEGESQFFLLGVSPKNPDLVFGRVNGALKDTLLRSDNGGVSWTPVLTFAGDGADISAFTIRADGEHVIAGTINFGVKLSDDGGETWHDPPQKPKMACVGERPADGALFACGANWNPDKMAIGRSSDGGETWTKLMRFIDLDGELTCPAASGHVAKCAGIWQGIACQFGIGKGPDAGVADASVEPDAGETTSHPDCGCSIGIAAVFVVWPWPRRRRRP